MRPRGMLSQDDNALSRRLNFTDARRVPVKIIVACIPK
jgi:hypothetical protein